MTICRLCGSGDLASVVDLGATPPCERFLTAERLDEPEVTYPLHLRVCTSCWLAQIPPLITPEDTFTDYAYFSSYSTSWVEHARTFVAGLRLGRDAFVVEVASNDGYLLRHVVERGVRCLGDRAVGERGRGGPAAGGADADGLPHPGDGRARCAAEHGPADLRGGQQRLRAHPGRGRLHRGAAHAGGRRRLGLHRGAAPAHADRAEPVRHDLPRALPVLHGRLGAAGAGRAAG